MVNHPNRSRAAGSEASSPTSEEIRAAREAACLTQLECARMVYTALGTWHQWEADVRRMHPAFWELWQIKAAKLEPKP
jgi:putative transcriptional regulator